MNDVFSIHEMAMEMNMEGEAALAKGRSQETALAFFQKAYFLERKATLVISKENDPVNYFIFMRSAAALANKAEFLEEAEKLIAIAESQNPPEWIAEELAEISQLVNTKKKDAKEASIDISGTFAEANTLEQEITIEDEKQNAYSIFVPIDVLKFVVKSYLLDKVSVRARQTKTGLMVLENIQGVA